MNRAGTKNFYHEEPEEREGNSHKKAQEGTKKISCRLCNDVPASRQSFYIAGKFLAKYSAGHHPAKPKHRFTQTLSRGRRMGQRKCSTGVSPVIRRVRSLVTGGTPVLRSPALCVYCRPNGRPGFTEAGAVRGRLFVNAGWRSVNAALLVSALPTENWKSCPSGSFDITSLAKTA